MLPDEIFVHRNLGNILSNGDLSSESAVEWCVGLLKVCSCFFALCAVKGFLEQGGVYGKEVEGMRDGRDRRCNRWKRGEI